jgi:hypothetical protein
MGGLMVKIKREKEPKKDDAEQFRLFLEAARNRSMNESLEDFATRFGMNVAPKPKPKSL